MNNVSDNLFSMSECLIGSFESIEAHLRVSHTDAHPDTPGHNTFVDMRHVDHVDQVRGVGHAGSLSIVVGLRIPSGNAKRATHAKSEKQNKIRNTSTCKAPHRFSHRAFASGCARCVPAAFHAAETGCPAPATEMLFQMAQ